MNKKVIFLSLIVLLIGSFFVIQALSNQQTDSQRVQDQVTGMDKSSLPAISDTTPSAGNVAHNVKMEIKELAGYVSSHPNDTTHVLRLARLYQDSHEPAKAITLYEQYVKNNKSSGVQPWLDLTNCYGETQQWAKALNATARTLKRFHNNPSALYNQGAIYANMQQYSKARKSWELVLKSNASADVMHITKQSLKKLDSMNSSQQ